MNKITEVKTDLQYCIVLVFFMMLISGLTYFDIEMIHKYTVKELESLTGWLFSISLSVLLVGFFALTVKLVGAVKKLWNWKKNPEEYKALMVEYHNSRIEKLEKAFDLKRDKLNYKIVKLKWNKQ